MDDLHGCTARISHDRSIQLSGSLVAMASPVKLRMQTRTVKRLRKCSRIPWPQRCGNASED